MRPGAARRRRPGRPRTSPAPLPLSPRPEVPEELVGLAALVGSGRATRSEVARELDVNPSTVTRWLDLAWGRRGAAKEAGRGRLRPHGPGGDLLRRIRVALARRVREDAP